MSKILDFIRNWVTVSHMNFWGKVMAAINGRPGLKENFICCWTDWLDINPSASISSCGRCSSGPLKTEPALNGVPLHKATHPFYNAGRKSGLLNPEGQLSPPLVMWRIFGLLFT